MKTSFNLRILFPTLHLILDVVYGANILFLSPHTSHSHSHFFFYIIKELAARGHTITHWNGLRPREQMVNVTQLFSPELDHFNTHHPIGFSTNNRALLLLSLPFYTETVCNACYTDPVFHRLLKSNEHFDLVVIESFLNECMLPFTTHFKAPFIYISGLPPSAVMLDITCSPMNFASCPMLGLPLSDEMNFIERTYNFWVGMSGLYFRNNFILPVVDRLATQIWTNITLPSVKEIENNVSLLITNTDLTTYHNYPKSNALIEAPGLHLLEPPKSLPQDLESFVSDSGDAGFIVLTFGTIVRGEGMPEVSRKMFVSAFSRLPQKVIWKWENATGMGPDLPPNIRLCTWLPPMLDLMAHSKMRLVITHGGLFTNQEAVWMGIPLIALPVFGDQPQYAARAQKEGYALHLDWVALTEDSLFNSIQEIIENPKYKRRALEVSQLMRDRMDNPLDRAAYWIEYVIRHQGAPHLKPNAYCQQSLFQRELLDVHLVNFVLFLLFVAFCLFFISRFASKIVQRFSRTCDKIKAE